MAPGRRAGGTGAARRPTRLGPRHDATRAHGRCHRRTSSPRARRHSRTAEPRCYRGVALDTPECVSRCSCPSRGGTTSGGCRCREVLCKKFRSAITSRLRAGVLALLRSRAARRDGDSPRLLRSRAAIGFGKRAGPGGGTRVRSDVASPRPLASPAVPAPTLGWPGRGDRQSRAPTGPHRSYAMSPLAVTQDQPHRLPADTVAGERPTATPGRFARREATQEQFRLRCADVHPVGCDVELVSSSRDDLVSRACSHGASAHGFTPVWYRPARLAAIAAEVAQTGRVRAGGARP